MTRPRRLYLVLAVLLCVTIGAQISAVVQRDGNFYAGNDVPIGMDFFAI